MSCDFFTNAKSKATSVGSSQHPVCFQRHHHQDTLQIYPKEHLHCHWINAYPIKIYSSIPIRHWARDEGWFLVFWQVDPDGCFGETVPICHWSISGNIQVWSAYLNRNDPVMDGDLSEIDPKGWRSWRWINFVWAKKSPTEHWSCSVGTSDGKFTSSLSEPMWILNLWRSGRDEPKHHVLPRELAKETRWNYTVCFTEFQWEKCSNMLMQVQ